MNPPGLVENVRGAAATVSLKGERGGGVREGGSWKGLLCSFIGSTVTTVPTANLAVLHHASADDPVLEPGPEFALELFRATQSSQRRGRKKISSPVNTMAPVKPSGHLCCDKNRFVAILLQIQLPKRGIEAGQREGDLVCGEI